MSSLACAAVAREGGAIRSDETRIARDAETARRAQGGDALAFERLYEENVSRVYALSYRLTGSADLADELTQEAFVRAWRKLGTYRGESAFSSWLYTLTVNTAFSDRRARRRREARITTTDDLSAFESGTAASPAAALDLERALETLPSGAREVFVLHDVEGFKHEEIARMTGIAAGTSKAQLHRARRLLREALGR